MIKKYLSTTFSSFLYLFAVFIYMAAEGMYLLFRTKMQSVGTLDRTAWSTGAHKSSSNY